LFTKLQGLILVEEEQIKIDLAELFPDTFEKEHSILKKIRKNPDYAKTYLYLVGIVQNPHIVSTIITKPIMEITNKTASWCWQILQDFEAAEMITKTGGKNSKSNLYKISQDIYDAHYIKTARASAGFTKEEPDA